MRLQLIGALLLIAPVRASAEPDDAPTAAATLRVYADDDDMTVVSPSLSLTGVTAAGVAIDLDGTVDAVSGASVDVVTSASPRAIDERRVDLGVAASRPLPHWDGVALSLDGRVSHEADYLALRGGAGARIEREARNLIVDLRYPLGHDRIAAVSDPMFHRTRIRHGAVVAISLVLGARTVADLAIEVASASGYHASPYRRIALVDAAAPLPTWFDEATPWRQRCGGAAAAARGPRRLVRQRAPSSVITSPTRSSSVHRQRISTVAVPGPGRTKTIREHARHSLPVGTSRPGDSAGWRRAAAG